jgi:hypothetical protein
MKRNLRVTGSTYCSTHVLCLYAVLMCVCVQVVGTEYDTDRSRTPFHGYQLIAQSQVRANTKQFMSTIL